MRNVGSIRIFLGLFLFSLLIACNAKPGLVRPDAGRRDSGASNGDGGGGTTGNTRCGQINRVCCGTPARDCGNGLKCEQGGTNGSRCCTPAGVTTNVPGDCCTGLQWDSSNMRCHVPAGAACTPSGNECGSQEICVGNVCVNNPNANTCGFAGADCCRVDGGPAQCNAGLVCNNSNKCATCGGEGQPCCPNVGCNSTATAPLLCDQGSLTCIVPTGGCGEMDAPCCGTAGCYGLAVCLDGHCSEPPPDCGAKNQVCCTERNICKSGLLCDMTMRKCVDPPSDCGTLDQMCCDTPSSTGAGACTGALNCEFGACSDCVAPSFTCALNPGSCCNGSTCKFSPLPRCCMGSGGACSNDTDCCGVLGSLGFGLRCVEGTCEGGTSGFCVLNSDCAAGYHCSWANIIPACVPDETSMCIAAGDTCGSDSGTCCTGLSCGRDRTDEGNMCCARGESTCSDNNDCCGKMECQNGACACIMENGKCTGNGECCEGFECVVGECATVQGCKATTRTECGNSGGDCCGDMQCTVTRDSNAATNQYCCSPPNFRCEINEDCCGSMQCVDRVCVKSDEGAACGSDDECKRLDDGTTLVCGRDAGHDTDVFGTCRRAS